MCSWGHGVMELDICIGYETPPQKEGSNHLLPWTDSLWFVLSTGIRSRFTIDLMWESLQTNAIKMPLNVFWLTGIFWSSPAPYLCLFFSRLKGRTRVLCVCQIPALWRAWGISSLIPHHGFHTFRWDPQQSPLESWWLRQPQLKKPSWCIQDFWAKDSPCGPQKSTWSFRASGLNESDGFNYLGSKKAAPNMPLTRTG